MSETFGGPSRRLIYFRVNTNCATKHMKKASIKLFDNDIKNKLHEIKLKLTSTNNLILPVINNLRFLLIISIKNVIYHITNDPIKTFKNYIFSNHVAKWRRRARVGVVDWIQWDASSCKWYWSIIFPWVKRVSESWIKLI